ncbi:MAG: hypothetical protein WD768_21940 [Phycisphaeraceae bacterium]
MPIRFECDACGARVKVPDGTAGRRVKCPSCGKVQVISKATPKAAVVQQTSARKAAEPVSVAAPAPETSREEAADQAGDDSTIGVEAGEHAIAESPVMDDLDESTEEFDDEFTADDETSEAEMQEDVTSEMRDMTDESADDEGEGDDDEIDNEAMKDHVEERDRDEPVETVSVAAPVEVEDVAPVAPVKPEPARGEAKASGDQALPDRASIPVRTAGRGISLDSEPRQAKVPAVAPVATAPLAPPAPTAAASVAAEVPAVPIAAPMKPEPPAEPPPMLAVLLFLSWALRILAVLALGSVAKLMLLFSDAGASATDILFTLPLGLGVVGVIWGVGEMARVTRDRARQP